MPTPSSGQISFRDIAAIVYNNAGAQSSLNDSDVRALLGVPSGQISMSSAYNKPTAGNTGGTYYSPGNYTWVVVPYQYLYVDVRGGGGAGGGYCGGQFFFGCVNYRENPAGGGGNQSFFNGVFAYGGGGGRECSRGAGAAGGNNQNGSVGGGGGGGAGSTNAADTNCNQAAGSPGGAGGRAVRTWTKAVDGPAYGTAINFSVGAGGTAGCNPDRCQPGSPGGNGLVYIAWS